MLTDWVMNFVTVQVHPAFDLVHLLPSDVVGLLALALDQWVQALVPSETASDSVHLLYFDPDLVYLVLFVLAG